jgi:hypothetical protein
MLLLLLDADRPPDSATLRVNIDGEWTASEMSASFNTINYIYNMRMFLEYQQDILEAYYDSPYFLDFPPFRRFRKLGHPLPHFNFFTWHQYLDDPRNLEIFVDSYLREFKLDVTKLKFGSEGNKDFLGVGEILKQVREFIQFLVMLPQNKEQMNLSNDAQRIENARNMLKLRRERSEAELEIAELDALSHLLDHKSRPLIALAEQKKITSVEIVDESEDVT